MPDKPSSAAPEARRSTAEPIAVLGIGCRFPGGVSSAEDLWRLLLSEGDVISPFPSDRGWNLDTLFGPDPGAPGATYVRGGGFLTDVADFDAPFFGISPREAQAMDPQQRLLLETTWEALERSGIDPTSLRDSNTGVFVGSCVQEYGPRIYDDKGGLASHLTTGSAISVASGRIAYTLGLHGPAVTVDTACSSSLVALHLAVQSLRADETDMAVVGAATVMCSPSVCIGFDRQGALAPDGRSKPFAASADGFGISEGVAVLVLARLSRARSLGCPVLAVIRGSAMNQDGASNTLTSPSGAAQQRVIRQALRDAGLTAADVDVVEAHGTGTRIGDPIEAEALQATYGEAHSATRPVLVGSVKSNIGHTQFAAGLAGVIKAIQSIRHGIVPATVHLDSPTPQVDWSSGSMKVLSAAAAWPDRPRQPRRAGVSAFGISGTNAHVILEQAVPPSPTAASAHKPSAVTPWVLSAKSVAALAGQASALKRFVEQRSDVDPTDIAYSLVRTRASFDHRAVVVGADRSQLLNGLAAVAAAVPAAGVVSGRVRPPGKMVFVFPGQGSQWPGMAADMLDTAPAFRDEMLRCEAAFAEFVDWSLLDVVRTHSGAPSIDRTDVIQPVLFAMMVSLAAQWRALGIEPDAVIGHSQGEIAAAYVAGALTLHDAAKVVCLRSRAATAIAGTGGMVSIHRPVDQVCAMMKPWRDAICVAAQNGPSSTVVTGETWALTELLARCMRDDIPATSLPVDYASHSVAVDELRDTLRKSLTGLCPRTTDVAYISTVTGAKVDTSILDGEYWFANLRQPVLFEDAVRWSYLNGHRRFVECSPHPVLTIGIEESLNDYAGDHSVVPTLRRNEGDLRRFLQSVGEAYLAGSSPNWESIFDGTGARQIDLPTYAFQRKRYWLAPTLGFVDTSRLGVTPADHPLVGATLQQADSDEIILTGQLSVSSQPWLADHRVRGVIVVPGAAMVEIALQAGEHVECPRVDQLVLHSPLTLGETTRVAIQIIVGTWSESGDRPIRIFSRIDDGRDRRWTRHADGLLTAAVRSCDIADTEPWPPAEAEQIDVSAVDHCLSGSDLQYGPTFRGLQSLWRRGNELFVEAALPPSASNETDRFGLHPALLDAVLQAIVATEIPGESAHPKLPFEWEGVSLEAIGARRLRARIRQRGDDRVAITLMDARGRHIGNIDSLALRRLQPGRLPQGSGADDDLYSLGCVALAPVDTSAETHGATVLACQTVCADTASAAVTTRATLADVMGKVQTWLSHDHADERLVVVTRHAVEVDSSDPPVDLAQAAVWGMLRSAQGEHPGRIVLADIDDRSDTDVAVAHALGRDEPQLVIRGEVCLAPRLGRPDRQRRETAATLDVGGTVLITGGTGTLGTLLARHLVTEHGVRNLLLVSRSGRTAEHAAGLESELAGLGASVRAASCDAAERDSLAELLGGIPTAHPLKAVIHLAGELADAVFTAQTPDHLDVVARPKIDAAWNLHELTLESDLSAFVLFSSAAGILGSGGQANYSAANAFLDALAQHRRSRGLPAVSMAWGWWAQDTGMTSHLDERARARLGRGGFIPMSSADALALFDAALEQNQPVIVPAQFDFNKVRAQSPIPPMFRSLVRPARRTVESEGTSEPSVHLRERLQALSMSQREDELLRIVRSHAAAVLGYDSTEDVDPDREFVKELGFDSLCAVELWNRLRSATGLKLPTTAIFDNPTSEALTRYLATTIDA